MISAVDEASATIRFAAPKRVLSWWWSMSTTSAARSSASGSGPIRRSDAQSTATSVRWSASSGSVRARSARSRKRYSPGSGASPERYITTSLPSPRSARVSPSIEPRASPSGFSCVTTSRRSARVSAATTASRSFIVVISLFLVREVARELVDERRHPHSALDRVIVFEGQRRGPAEAELLVDPRLQEPVRRPQAIERGAPLLLAAEHRDEDLGFAEVRRDADARDRDHADAGVFQVLDAVGDDCADRLVDSPHTLGHRRAA